MEFELRELNITITIKKHFFFLNLGAADQMKGKSIVLLDKDKKEIARGIIKDITMYHDHNDSEITFDGNSRIYFGSDFDYVRMKKSDAVGIDTIFKKPYSSEFVVDTFAQHSDLPEFTPKQRKLPTLPLTIEKRKDKCEHEFTTYNKTEDIENVDMCISVGTDINQTDQNGNTLLINVCKAGNTDVARMLIDRGANLNLENIFGYTALWCASANRFLDIVKMLVDAGADIDPQNHIDPLNPSKRSTPLRSSPLYIASAQGHLEIAKMLVDAGANVNSQSPDGNTPLLKACSNIHLKTAKMLVDAGADIAIPNNHNDSPLSLVYFDVNKPDNHQEKWKWKELLSILLNIPEQETNTFLSNPLIKYILDNSPKDSDKVEFNSLITSSSAAVSPALEFAIYANRFDLFKIMYDRIPEEKKNDIEQQKKLIFLCSKFGRNDILRYILGTEQQPIQHNRLHNFLFNKYYEKTGNLPDEAIKNAIVKKVQESSLDFYNFKETDFDNFFSSINPSHAGGSKTKKRKQGGKKKTQRKKKTTRKSRKHKKRITHKKRV
jgi:ankyrin repeat protein